jgi:hypothetical protein
MADEEPKLLKKADGRTIDRSKMVPLIFEKGATGKDIVDAMIAQMEAEVAEKKAKAEAAKKNEP